MTRIIEKRPALGKGLSALIPDVPEPPRGATVEVDVDRILPNRYQPRQQVDAEGIEDLARSIAANGIIQPIIVRRVDGGFQIIAGERRWRAAQHAGLLKVPVVVKDIEPGHEGRMLEMALIENIQREDLNPIEEALAYRRLGDEFDLTQEQISTAVGKDRSSIANIVRLLRLPQVVRDQVSANVLSMGHARALLALEQEAAISRAAAEVVAKRLSVRDTEALVKRLIAAPPKPKPAKPSDVHTRAAEQDLRMALGTPVRILRKRKGGKIEVEFKSEDELQRLYERMTGK
jgi:ParB family chromosome partitioning protein